MNGWAPSGNRSAEKNRPEKIHIGNIIRFISPLTVSVVWARLAMRRPIPRERQGADDLDQGQKPEAAHDRHPEHEHPQTEQHGDVGDEEGQPGQQDRQEEIPAGHRRGREPLEQLADPEVDQQETDAPKAAAHRVLADQAGDQEVDVP